jgi:hypothetical protein
VEIARRPMEAMGDSQNEFPTAPTRPLRVARLKPLRAPDNVDYQSPQIMQHWSTFFRELMAMALAGCGTSTAGEVRPPRFRRHSQEMRTGRQLCGPKQDGGHSSPRASFEAKRLMVSALATHVCVASPSALPVSVQIWRIRAGVYSRNTLWIQDLSLSVSIRATTAL